MGQSIIYSNGCDIELINSEVSSNNDSEEVIFFIDSYVLINTSIISNNNSAQNLIKSQNTELSINHSLISNNQNNWRASTTGSIRLHKFIIKQCNCCWQHK